MIWYVVSYNGGVYYLVRRWLIGSLWLVSALGLCLLCGAHKTRTTPYRRASDGLVEHFNRTLLMMLAMFAGENRDDLEDLLPAVMMEYRSSVHESTGFSPYRLMFGEECTLALTALCLGRNVHGRGPTTSRSALAGPYKNPYALWVRDALEVAYDQVRRNSGQAVRGQKRFYDRRALRRLFAVGDWIMRYYLPAKCDIPWYTGPAEIIIIDVSLVPLDHIGMWRSLLSWDSRVICLRAS